ncbi:MAG: DUF1566 domain-containing protein [Gammaproteobacteria bacterium]|nr:DUF1566 domain-containing protein [Gammaproteobacteria bacterium]
MNPYRPFIRSKFTQVIFVLLLLVALQSPAQDCVDTIASTSRAEHYHVNNNGTIDDIRLHITWMQCNIGQIWRDGQCTGSAKTVTWEEALQTASASRFASFSDWRLPTLHELSSIIELRCQQPAINLTLFPASMAGDYWTATIFSNNTGMAWLVHFAYGENHTALKSISGAVRLIRSTND